MIRLVVEDTGFGLRGALLDQDRLIELVDADAGGEGVTDALFLARVRAIDHHLNAAFLDIGAESPAFLAARDARAAAGSSERRPIGQLLKEGQRLLVQGLREAGDDKGPRVTTEIALWGFHLALRPHGGPLEVSQRLRGRMRDTLQARGETLFPDGGVLLRRLAALAGDAQLLAEAERLGARWQRLQARLAKGGQPGRVSEEEHPLERLLRAVIDQAPARIEIAEPALLARARTLLREVMGDVAPGLEGLDPGRSAFEQTGVAAEIERALAVDVPLAGGGRIRIEPTAACVAIDVDGEGRTALDVDLEAAVEIGRQVRLRNLGGTLIVDFVDLPTRPQRQRLEEALKKAFHGDPASVQIHPMSPLGIVQISRARRGRSLEGLFGRACTCCGGSGHAPSLRHQAEQLIQALRLARSPLPPVEASADLARFLDGPASWAWRAWAEAGARLVTVPTLPAGQWRLGTRR